MAIKEFHGKSLGVFGLGKAGRAAIDELLASGAKVFAWDDNSESCALLAAEYKNKPVNFSDFAQWDWENIATLVLSPGVPFTHPKPHAVVEKARQEGCPVISEVELLYKKAPDATYIGITGTNGKSTTTALIGHIAKEAGLKVQMGGNIGTPACSLPALAEGGVYVLELSSYQLDLLHNVRFNIAVLLNITPDHLDRHGDMQGYIAAKKHIFDRQEDGDAAIIAIDDDHTMAIYKDLVTELGKKIIPVSGHQILDFGVYIKNSELHSNIIDERLQAFVLGEMKYIPGEHNQQNIVAAFASMELVGVNADDIINAIKSFKGLAHRIELVAEVKGVAFINDSKATNAVAAEKALKSFNNIFWIAGGVQKEGGISSLEPLFSKINHVYLIGAAAEAFAKTLDGKVEYTICETLENAVKQAAAAAFTSNKKKPVVLLSPACASFDQFKNFEERGEHFTRFVREYV